MTFTSGDKVPYAPPATVIEVLRRYRERGIPGALTPEALERAGVPESLSRRTLQAFRLLGLVDDEGNPEPAFSEANRLPEPAYLESMRDLICGPYSEVIAFADPASDSYDKVRDAFRPYDPQGQQERMVVLFLGLLDYVGVSTSAASTSRTRIESGTPSTRKSATSNSAPEKKAPRKLTREVVQSRVVRRRTGNDDALVGLPPGLVGLLRQIPQEGALGPLRAVIDF